MPIINDIKRSLGFEETESRNRQKNNNPSMVDLGINFVKSKVNGIQGNSQQKFRSNNQQQFHQRSRQQFQNSHRHTQSSNPRYTQNSNTIYAQNHNSGFQKRPSPVYEDDNVIVPEQSFYEIVLIRPKTIDDINYVVDQVIEEKNPVILDLSFLENESTPNFKLAGDKIKQMRTQYGVQALLLAHTEDKNLLVISPKQIKIINKG